MIVEFEKYINKTREAKEFKSVFEYFFSIIEDKLNDIENNMYIRTCTLAFIKAWEYFYKIPIDDTLSLEDRRQQVLMTKLIKIPYTKNSAIQQIRAFTGLDNEITEDEENLHINIDLTGSTNNIIKLVKNYMRKIKPTNVTYSISVTPKDLYDDSTFYMGCIITQNIAVI